MPNEAKQLGKSSEIALTSSTLRSPKGEAADRKPPRGGSTAASLFLGPWRKNMPTANTILRTIVLKVLQLQSSIRSQPFSLQISPKIIPGPSQIHPRGLQNQAQDPPKHPSGKTSFFEYLKRATIIVFWCQRCDFGSNFGVQNPSKMRPKGEKSDVDKRHVFFLAFFMVRAWFLGGFLTIFSPSTLVEVKKTFCQKPSETLPMAIKSRVDVF